MGTKDDDRGAPQPVSQPILTQLSLTAERLGAWLGEAGHLLRLGAGRPLPLRLVGADVGPTLSEVLPDDVDAFLERRAWTFPEPVADGVVRYVHSGNARLVLRVTLQGGEVVDAALASPQPTSEQDREECRALVAAALAGEVPPGRTARAEPNASARPAELEGEPLLEWSEDKLTIRLARPDLTRPEVRVTFFDGSLPVEQSVVSPLFLRDGMWLYEVWLVGPREGLQEARVHLV